MVAPPVKTPDKLLHRSLRRCRSGNTVVIVLVVAALAIVAIGLLAYFVSRSVAGESANHLTAVVEEADFYNDIVESGEVESSDNREVRCEVKSRAGSGTIILEVVPEGKIVKGPKLDEAGEPIPDTGEVLVTLDVSPFELEMQQEQIILNNKEASRDQAKNLLIAAITALKEYVGQEEFESRFLEELTDRLDEDAEDVLAEIQTNVETESTKGTFHVDEQGFQAELFLAEENLRKAEQYFRYSESLAAQGYVTELQLKSDEFAVEKALKDRDAAQTKLDVLRIHTKKKTEKTLTGDIYNALSVFRAEKSSVQLQKDRVGEIEEQIKKCIIRAPKDGQVVYANQRDHRGNADFLVEPGATVRERQVIIRLPNPEQMQIEAKISESKISYIKKGMSATVTIDAFDDMSLQGVVTRVNQYPEPSSWYSSSIKQYETEIQIVDPPPALKSGLTAKVRIHAQHIPNAKQVPIQSVYRHQDQHYCFVKENGAWRAQEVTLGASNEKQVVVHVGLEPGAEVSMNPVGLLEEVELPEVTLVNDEQIAANKNLAGLYAKTVAESSPSDRSPADDETRNSRAGGAAAMTPAAIVSTMFSRSDANNDSKLTKDELSGRFKGDFSEVDTNSDGGIDRAEMTAMLAKRMKERAGKAGGGQSSGAGE